MRYLLALCIAVASLSIADAKTVTVDEAQVKLFVPDDWKSERSQGWLTINHPTEQVAISFKAVPRSQIIGRFTEVHEQLKMLIEGLKMKGGEWEHWEVNGMKAYTQGGAGKFAGKKVEVSITIVETPSTAQALMIVGILDPGAGEKALPALLKIVKGIQPLKKR